MTDPNKPALADAVASWQSLPAKPQDAIDALDAGAASDFDTGALMELADLSKEGQYLIRIWPRFDEASQWWFDAALYTFGPVGLPRGMSPSCFGESDPFRDWLLGFPNDDSAFNKSMRSMLPGRRVLCIAQFRQHAEYELGNNDPAKLYLINMPRKKCGFEDNVDPVVREWVKSGQNPVDLYSGLDSVFTVTGKGGTYERQTPGRFQFVGEPGPAGTPELTAYLYETYYMPLSQSFARMTQSDIQEWRDYFGTIAQFAMANPDVAINFIGKKNFANLASIKQSADQWVSSGSVTHSPATSRSVSPPVLPDPTNPAGSDVYRPGTLPAGVPGVETVTPAAPPVAAPATTPGGLPPMITPVSPQTGPPTPPVAPTSAVPVPVPTPTNPTPPAGGGIVPPAIPSTAP